MTALGVALVVSLPFLFVLAARPVQRRIALRNATRRPIESLLVIAGTLLGTAIITGSLIVGDTIDRSIRASAYEQLGPVDLTVTVSGTDEGRALEQALTGFQHPEVDGVLELSTASATAVGGDPPRIRPRAQIVETDFSAARAFGDDAEITGIHGPTPRAGRAAISRDLADHLGIGSGDDLTVHAYGQAEPLTVERVLPREGVAGFWPATAGRRSYNVFVAPGTIDRLYAAAPAADPGTGSAVEPPSTVVAVSNRGGVERGVEHTRVVRHALERTLSAAGIDARAVPVKRDLIDEAVEGSKALTQLYFTVGMFAVAAGVLLLVNIFVMLADDRRSELGMIRALGLRRLPLVTTFATEGWCYAVIASALGALLGIGVGRVIAWRADSILSSGPEEFALDMHFTFEQVTLLTGFAIGLAIAMTTIILTSIRTARINIIAAIRDLPDVKPRRTSTRRLGFGVVAVILGVALSIFGFGGPDQFALILGPVVAAAGVGLLVRRVVPGRALVSAISVLVLVWATAAVPISTELGAPLDIPLFLVQGLLMSAAAITLLVTQEDRLARLLTRASGDALALRVGLAYPLARRFRTGMTLGMFSIVVLTLVFMSQMTHMFNTQAGTFARELSGGFGAVVTSNPSNPIPPDELAAITGVTRVAPMSYQTATWTRPGETPVDWPLSGFGPELLDAPPSLTERGDYPSDRAAWKAVLEDPNLIIADQFFATPGAGPPPSSLEVGDRVKLVDRVSGQRRTLTVAAIANDDYLFSGAFMGQDAVRDVFGDRAVVSRYFVGAHDLDAAVREIRTEFMANGADADTVVGLIDVLLSQNNAFFTLMQQFVGVGLVVGIAGIGVIMVRAVRERRRQIGVLRAIGFSRRTVASTFIVEASFVAVAGTLMGVAIAVVSSWGISRANESWARGFEFGIAWSDIVIVVCLAVAASLVAAILPARAASDIHPAVALRIAD
ncbi:MAG: ABC transporter [Acidimicrobiia bacterium]